MAHTTLELPPLDWASETRAAVDGEALGEEQITLLLLRAVRQFASNTADGQPVSPVSVTIDTTAPLESARSLTIETALDRRTRTLVFAHGAARQGENAVMTATAVFRIETT